VVVVNKSGDAIEKDSHTMPAMEKELRAKLLFPRLGAVLSRLRLSGQRVGRSIFALALLAVEQHRRRVTNRWETKCCRGAELALSPPTSRAGARDASTTAPSGHPPPSFNAVRE